MAVKEEKKIREYFASLEMLTPNMEHWEQIISWRKQGIKKKMPDLLIAAIAKKSGYPVLTKNMNDFNQLDIEVENPWEGDTYFSSQITSPLPKTKMETY